MGLSQRGHQEAFGNSEASLELQYVTVFQEKSFSAEMRETAHGTTIATGVSDSVTNLGFMGEWQEEGCC